MRVTKIIREYIETEVNKKYKEKLNSIPNEYQEDYNKMIKEIGKEVKKCSIKVKEIAKKYDMLKEGANDIVSYSTYYLGNYDRWNDRQNLERKLKQERDDKIAEIILSLELGDTNKKELTEILKNVKF